MAAYSSPSAMGSMRPWEELRREARRLEGELDVKLAAYNKLSSSYETSYGGGDSAEQLSQTKAMEIESLLSRLSDTNDEMGYIVGGSHDARSHLLARHRDILQDYTQEFRRLNASLSVARDRVALLRDARAEGGSASPSGGALGGVGVKGALLRERAAVGGSTSAIDEVISTAQAVSSSLLEQRGLFGNIGDKVLSLGSRFPMVNSVLNAIRRKKNKDTLVLAAVIAGCVLFTLVYMLFK